MSNLIDSNLMAHIEEILEFAKDKGAFFQGERDRVEDTRDGAYDYYEGLVDGYGIMETKVQTLYNRAIYDMKQADQDVMWTCETCHEEMLYWQRDYHQFNPCDPCRLGCVCNPYEVDGDK